MKRIIKIVVLCTLQFLFLISCHSPDKDTYAKTFDISLINKNENLRQAVDYKAIILLNKEYLQLSRKIKYKDGEALCYINIAYVYTQTGNYKYASSLLGKAKAIVEKSENTLLKASFLREYGELNYFLDLPSRALDYNSKAIYYSKKIADLNTQKLFLNRSYSYRANIFFELGKHDSILHYYHKALKTEENLRTEASIAQYHLWHTKKLDSVALYLNKALVIVQKAKSQTKDASFVYFVAGTYNREIKDYKKSKEYYNESLQILDSKKNFSISIFYIFIYSDLMSVAKIEDNKKEEQYYFIKYSEAKEKLDKQKASIANLINEEFISEVKKDEQTDKTKILLYSGLILIVFLLLCFFLYKRVKYLRQKKEVLEQKTEKLESQIHDKRLDEVIALAKRNDSTFLARFREVYPDFTEKLLAINSNLENSELIFCAMLRLNFTSKEIANYMFIQHDSVQKRKSRIRKRLSIPGNVDLYHFLGKL